MRSVPPIIPNRKIEAVSAVLLPFDETGSPDYGSFRAHLERTFAAGLVPAVNMDTGYVNLLTPSQRHEILQLAASSAEGRRFIAGAFIDGLSGGLADQYLRQTSAIQEAGGIPILFQSAALTALPDDELVGVYEQVAGGCDALLAFELGQMFAPYGKIYSLEIFVELMKIPQITGIKHSSLNRQLEWERLALRDRLRPEFKIYTGNDLAVDMVMYGSDYLLGLSTFAPDYFAQRDACWLAGDARFYQLNDVLQYLGQFSFRHPVAAYKHSAAQFLKVRGWVRTSAAHPAALLRPESDLEILEQILQQLEALS